MPIDERVREGLERIAHLPAPDARANFRRAVVEARRRRRRNAILSTLGSAAVVMALLAVWPEPRAPTQQAEPAHTVSPPSSNPIDGIYRTRITVADGLDAGLSLGKARILAGSRVLTIAFGTIRMVDPTSFETLPVNATCTVSDGRIAIDPAPDGSEPGVVLSWRRTAEGLALRVIGGAESPAQRAVWSAHPWRAIED